MYEILGWLGISVETPIIDMSNFRKVISLLKLSISIKFTVIRPKDIRD